jgi:hypothetical protein
MIDILYVCLYLYFAVSHRGTQHCAAFSIRRPALAPSPQPLPSDPDTFRRNIHRPVKHPLAQHPAFSSLARKTYAPPSRPFAIKNRVVAKFKMVIHDHAPHPSCPTASFTRRRMLPAYPSPAAANACSERPLSPNSKLDTMLGSPSSDDCRSRWPARRWVRTCYPAWLANGSHDPPQQFLLPLHG